MKLSTQHKSMFYSYARSFAGAALALYLSGITDPRTLANAGIAAVAPVLLRWLNPNDFAYGRKS